MTLDAGSDTHSKKPAERRRVFLFTAVLFLAVAVVYTIHFSPALYYDDWDQFAYRYFTGNLPWFLKGFVRPLNFATYRLQVELFGFNLNAFMAYRIFLLALEGALYFVILEKLKVFSSWLNYVCALIILVSPQDMTRMWLLMDPIMVVGLQIQILLLISYGETRRPAALLGSLVLCALLLMNYEAPLGLMMAFSVFYFIFRAFHSNERRVLLLAPFILGTVYLGYRAAGSLFGVASFHAAQPLTVIYLLRQVRNGLVSFLQGWFLPVQMDPAVRFAAVGALAVSLGIYIAHAAVFGFDRANRQNIKRAFILIGIGGFFWLAGYFPWIAYGIPSSIHWFNTRAHIFALPGSAVSLAAVLEWLGGKLNVQARRKALLSAALALPLLVIGIQAQVNIQWESKHLWQEYRAMWQGIFDKVPDFQGNPHVVLIIHPGVKDLRYGEHDFYTMASFNVEISRALTMFYGRDLEGEFMYENMEVPQTPVIHDDGITNPPTYSGKIPYSEIVFIRFDRLRQEVKVVRDLKLEFGVDDPTYNPDKFIRSKTVERQTMRYILN